MGSAATSGRTCACPDPVPGNEGPGWTLLPPGGGGPPLPAGGGGPPVSPPGPPRPPGGGGPPRPPDAGGAGLIAGGGAGGGATPCPGGGATPRPLPSGTPRPPGAPGEAPATIQQSRSGRSDTASMRLAQTLRQRNVTYATRYPRTALSALRAWRSRDRDPCHSQGQDASTM